MDKKSKNHGGVESGWELKKKTIRLACFCC